MTGSMGMGASGGTAFGRRAMEAPTLTHGEELRLATAYAAGDRRAGDEIVSAHLRIALGAAAAGGRRYGLPVDDLVGEACVGLMKALERFDASRGFRFGTYARWWVRASIQEYALGNWSMVRVNTGSRRKSAFFALKRLRASLEASMGTHETGPVNERIAAVMGMATAEVESLSASVEGRDASLDAPFGEAGGTWGDRLVDGSRNPEEEAAEAEAQGARSRFMEGAIASLGAREAEVVHRRAMADDEAGKETLAAIAVEWKVSKERVRQVEASAMAKVARMARASRARGLIVAW